MQMSPHWKRDVSMPIIIISTGMLSQAPIARHSKPDTTITEAKKVQHGNSNILRLALYLVKLVYF